MINDLQNNAFIDVIDRLLFFVVIDQNQLFLLIVEQMITGDRTDDLPFFI